MAIEQARELRPDLILMDIEMPNCNGLEAVKRITQELPQIKIIMLTVSDSDEDLFTAIKEGAQGYLLKESGAGPVIFNAGRCSTGRSPYVRGYGRQNSAGISATGRAGERAPRPAPIPTLSEREVEVLQLVVAGLSNKDIAEKLHITRNTVKMHLRSILEKLHVQNRVQAAVYAVKEGLVPDTELPDEEYVIKLVWFHPH
jgi:DNA-binding NarL/FixJ family response regulator